MTSGFDSNLGGDGGSSDLKTGITVDTKDSGEEGIELGVENSIGNKLLFGVKLF